MEAYFDNSATTKALDSVRDIMVKTLTEDFGNPSAKHTKGMEAENYIRHGFDWYSAGKSESGKAHYQYQDRACIRLSATGISGVLRL